MKPEYIFVKIASRLMRQPAVAYHESMVWTQVEAICKEHGLKCEADHWGNRHVRYATAPKQRPVVLAAHMDHPGFEVIKQLAKGRWHARFLGGVGDAWFKRNVLVRLHPGDIKAKLGKRLGEAKEFELVSNKKRTQAGRTVPRFGVWDLEGFAVRKGTIHGRACDDLIGVASILATLIELKRRRAKAHVIGLITRAEEVGFQGALAAAADGLIPQNSLAISLETSREMPPVKMGLGVIVRVGDRASIFSSKATRFLAEIAGDLQKTHKAFQWQRALMSGGTCEATVFQEYGIETAAVCVALGNYHNCGANHRIKAEFVSAHDAETMVALLVQAACRMPEFSSLTGRLNERLDGLLKEGRQRLGANG